MFIRTQKSPTSKRVQVHLVENYRNDKGQPRQRIIKRYGELSELKAEDADILVKLAAQAKELTRAKQEARVAIEVDCLRERKQDEHSVGYGYFFLEALYRKLGLPSFFRKANHGRAAYDLESIVELLVFSRVLAPASKSATFEAKVDYFRRFDCQMHDIYRALDDLNNLADDLQWHVHKQIGKYYGRDMTLVFYDVTNYYFESDLEDDFRKKGLSKEHRRDPIVQMGLLIDSAGIPIAYRMFDGNIHDAKTLVPILQTIKDKYGFSRIIVVADKGLNGKDNLSFITDTADGYIVSQKVRGRVDPEIVSRITDRNGWTFNDSGSFAYKSFIREHRLSKDKVVSEKVVCYWSEQYAKRERHRRGDLVDGIEYLVSHPAAYDAANDYGRKRYVKEQMVTPAGEVVKKVLSFNEERFKTDAALDGFYAILTSEKEMTDSEIIEHYRGLARIEESFRVIKSELEGRPVFVWTRPRINAHFAICFLALVLLRLLQLKTDGRISTHAIIDGLKSATCSPLEKGIYIIEETNAVYKELERSFGVSLPNRYVPVETIKAYRRNVIAGA